MASIELVVNPEPTVDDYLPRLAWEEYLRIEDPEGLRIEFEDGRLLVSPSGRLGHNVLRDILLMLLALYEERFPGRCFVISESSFFMPPGKRDYQPDVGVVVDDRPIDPHEWLHGAPDIAIEVLSPSTRHRDLGLKARRYYEQDADEYWLFDPEEREARFLRRGARDWIEAPLRRGVYTTPLLPTFRLNLDEVWSRLDAKLRRPKRKKRKAKS